MDNNRFEIDFLTDAGNYYLSSNCNMQFRQDDEEFDLSDIALYRIEEVSFEEQAPRKEALENVLSTMKIEGINFIYLINLVIVFLLKGVYKVSFWFIFLS